jgi:hypothetical protein
MNTILYIGLGFLLFGFILFIVSVYMESYYDRKLYEINQRLQKDEQWRKKQSR